MGRDDYVRLIIAAGGAIAWWLKQRKQPRGAENSTPRKEASSEDPDLAERTRRIRTEIQRKIEQRTKAYKGSDPLARSRETQTPPPVIREVAKPRVEPPVLPKRNASRMDAQKNAEILEQQAALVEQLRQAKELKAASARRVQFENQISDGESTISVVVSDLKKELRDPAAVRRAFVLREIIGPPVALR